MISFLKHLKNKQCHTKLNQLKNYPLIQLETSTTSIKDLLNDILDERKGFKYQTTLKVVFKKTKVLKLNFLEFALIRRQN